MYIEVNRRTEAAWQHQLTELALISKVRADRAKGYTIAEIASRLHISESTVRRFLK